MMRQETVKIGIIRNGDEALKYDNEQSGLLHYSLFAKIPCTCGLQ